MEQKTTLSKSIDTTEQKAQYDAACKKVLAEKIILAWIMKHTMKEYVNYDVREIVERFLSGISDYQTWHLLLCTHDFFTVWYRIHELAL